MRRYFPIAVLVVVCLLQACNNDTRRELFEMNYVIDFDVPAGLNTIETHFFVDPSISSFFQQKLDAQDLTIDDVVAIEPKFASLTTVFNDEDLDFIRRFELRIFDPFDPDVTREIFYLDPVPNNTRTVIRPFPGLQDVKDLASSTTFGLQIRLTFRRIPSQTYDMRLAFDLSAKAID